MPHRARCPESSSFVNPCAELSPYLYLTIEGADSLFPKEEKQNKEIDSGRGKRSPGVLLLTWWRSMFALASLGPCLASSAAACACSCCTLATREALKSSARVAWSLLFTFSLLFSWVLRDFAKPLISNIPCEFPETCSLRPTWTNLKLLLATEPPYTLQRGYVAAILSTYKVCADCRDRQAFRWWRDTTGRMVWSTGCVSVVYG